MVSIKYSDPTQESEQVQELAAEVAKILTENEEILYLAMQNATAMSVKPDCVAATNNRVILFAPAVFGRVSFMDFQWQDVANTKVEQGTLSSEFRVEAIDGRTGGVGSLDKEQAKRLYGVCQQLEQEWREKRRIREMEELRAKSGGVYMAGAPETRPAIGDEDAVARLAKAKTMLDQGLISEAEYDTLKAKILTSM